MIGSVPAGLSHGSSSPLVSARLAAVSMSSSSANLHSKRLPSESERSQRLPDMDVAQQLKLRERQRFFEEVFQHDVGVYLSSAHLCIRDYKRPTIGSISSMEVNVDLLDQMELVDVSDQETLDVFLSSGSEDGLPASPLPVQGHRQHEDAAVRGPFRHVLEGGKEAKSRGSSTSSCCSSDSQSASTCRDDDPPEGGAWNGTMKRRAAAPETPTSRTPLSPS